MTPRRGGWATFAVVVLVVLAGCAAPARNGGSPGMGQGPTAGSATVGASPTTTTTASGAASTATTAPDEQTTDAPGTDEESSIAVRNGSLPVDAGRVFADVAVVLDENVSPPDYVRVVDDPAALAPDVAGRSVPAFWRLVGLEPERALDEAELDRLENGVTTGLGSIVVYPGSDPTPARVRWLLAHEFVHYVGLARGWGRPLGRQVDVRTTDGAFVARSVSEGAAVYATDAYLQRRGSDVSNAAVYDRLAAEIPAGSPAAYVNDAYVVGNRYVAGRVVDQADLRSVFERPPRTSEQVIHGHPPETEPPAALPVAVNATGSWRPAGTDRLGEAFVRAALANGVTRERAARAAAGWGNDSLRAFRSAGSADAGYVWLLRWDDAANRSEFETALRAHLDALGNRTHLDAFDDVTGEGWRLADATAVVATPDDRTVALVVGPTGFVANATVVGTGGRIRIRVGHPLDK